MIPPSHANPDPARSAATDAAVTAEGECRCELLLVAHRRPGRTHKFFRGWRIEAALTDGPNPGPTHFSVPVEPVGLAAPGVHYDLRLTGDRPESATPDSAAFAWALTAHAGGPDRIAAALARAQERLRDEDWRQDPAAPTVFRRAADGGA